MTAGIPRCMRCATLLRNDRKVCPSCGLTLSADSTPPSVENAVVERQSARANLKICPACSHSVVVEEMVEFEGQMHCADCAKGLRAKAEKRKAS